MRRWKRSGGGMIFGHQQNAPSPAQQSSDEPASTDAPAPDPMRIIDPTAGVQTPALDDLDEALDNPEQPSILEQPIETAAPLSVPETDTKVDEPVDPVRTEPTHTATSEPASLLDLKKEAIGQLSPLIEHLDQSPEEKFRTTMMLIQSTDNSDLLKDAYEVAKSIEDEKVRAQALLDIVNEINYFTHSKETSTES